jgi:hypothetical protein
MKTVFDLVALVCVMKREKEGDTPVVTYRELVLDSDISPSCACAGRTVFELAVKRMIKPHIKTEGLERVWLKDWDLRERKVQEARAA